MKCKAKWIDEMRWYDHTGWRRNQAAVDTRMSKKLDDKEIDSSATEEFDAPVHGYGGRVDELRCRA